MNLEQLRYFLSVAAEGSFARAAQTMFITKNGLTYQIKQMERELGFELFERDSHHVDVTPRAAVLLPAVREMLALWDDAVDRAVAGASDVASTLEVGMAYFMDQELLGLVDAEFKRLAPGTSVRPRYSAPFNPSAFVDGLVKGALDAAFMSKREVGGARSLSFAPLCPMYYGFHVARDHPLAQRADVGWGDLDGQAVVLLSGVRRPENRLFMGDTEALFKQRCPNAAIAFADCLEAEKYVVEHEGAVGVIPFTSPRDIDTDRFVLKVLADEVEEFGIAYPAGSDSRLLRAYLEACSRVYGERG